MSAKQYFRSIGQQLATLGLRVSQRPQHYKTLPAWAREQIAAGYISQLPAPGVEQRKSELAAKSMVRS